MALSILDSLKEIDPKVTFADSQNQFTQAEGIASSLNQPLPNIGTFKDSLNFPQVSLGNVTDTISAVPVSADELKAAVSGKIDKIKDINLESLQAAIPETPTADNFKDFDVKSLNSTISSLSQELTGGLSISNVPPAAQNVFGEFEEFVNKASMLPARMLDALLKVFKKLLDKLSNPEDLLSQIGPNVLTDIFKGQINNLNPGNLVKEFIGPYIDSLVSKLNDYKPSKILQPVKDLYQELLVKLDVLNPKQLLDKLE
ncbi:MAG: hypothetical protein V7K41_15335 [Nostoc sp.]|uniref:hypothetical protein n=1 Tax=Nostoc sp. TaxID=1180 RepID=UPI002FFCB956